MRDGDAIAAARGGKRYDNGWTFRCPVHQPDKNPSCWMWNDGGLYCHAKCSPQAIAAALDALGFPDNGAAPPPQSDEERHALDAQAIRRAQELWADSEACNAVIAESNNYWLSAQLRDYRGILLPVPAVMRRFKRTERIVCYQRLDGTITAVHIKRYGPEYLHLGKGYIQGRVSGMHGAVQLATPATELGLAEGVETALAAQQLFHIPTWAALSADLLHQVAIPPSIKVIHLFADNDNAGLEALTQATQTYTDQGYDIWQWVPRTDGADWNDYLKESAHAKN